MDVQEVSEGIRLLKLEPGDRLAVYIPADLPAEQGDQMVDALRKMQEEWGIKIWVFSGDIELTVIRED